MERLLNVIHRHQRLRRGEVFDICSDIIQELRMQSRFARMQAEEWDKLPREADKVLDHTAEKFAGIRHAADIAWIQAAASQAK